MPARRTLVIGSSMSPSNQRSIIGRFPLPRGQHEAEASTVDDRPRQGHPRQSVELVDQFDGALGLRDLLPARRPRGGVPVVAHAEMHHIEPLGQPGAVPPCRRSKARAGQPASDGHGTARPAPRADSRCGAASPSGATRSSTCHTPSRSHGTSRPISALIIGGVVLPPLNASDAAPRRRTASRTRNATRLAASYAGWFADHDLHLASLARR